MVSLQQFFSSIGIDSAQVSILDIAQQFDLDSSFSINQLIQVASGSPDPTNEDFRILPIEIDGSGDYRADRFRIYFRHPDGLFPLPVSNLVSELGRLFPQLLNGSGSEVDGLGLTQNVATTFYRFDKPFNSEPTLQFTADIRALFEFVNAPDLHDDWAGFTYQDSNSFAVQTLKRNFTQANDALFGLLIAEVLGLTVGGAPVIPIGGGLVAGFLNRYHFLAGRRSWVIAQANQARGSNFIANNPIADVLQEAFQARLAENQHIYVLETAAIDRFSSWVIDLADLVPGVVLSNMEQLVAEIWTILLTNFVKFMGFEPVTTNLSSTLYPHFSSELRDVRFIQASFNSRDECLSQGWVQDMLALHPGVAAQF